MIPTLPLLSLATGLSASGASPERWGLDPSPVPDFQLVDVNPSSATAGQTYDLAALQGRVSVVFFAGAT